MINARETYPRSAVIVQTGFLGDAVLVSGMLRALHALGVERIGLVVRHDVASIYEHHPAVSRLHALDKRDGSATRAMTSALASESYDVALVPHRSARSTLLVYRAGIKRRIGFRQSELALLHTDRVHYSVAMHELERNASLIERLGRRVSDIARNSWLEPQQDAVERMRTVAAHAGASAGAIADHAGAIVIAPGSVWATKRWNEERFSEVTAALVAAGRRVLFVGTLDDRELCLRIARQAGIDSGAVLAGELSLNDLVALCSMADRVVCNDSAPLHIAEAVGTPVTAMFGPTVPDFGFGPRHVDSVALGIELSCRPCRIHGGDRCPIRTHECMRRIASHDVMATIV